LRPISTSLGENAGLAHQVGDTAGEKYWFGLWTICYQIV
jgi:hypothetical protein